MSVSNLTPGMAEVSRLIADCFTDEHARRFTACRPSDKELRQLAEIGFNVMRDCSPPMPGACAIMSALYADRLAAAGVEQVHVLAGSLRVAGTLVFGSAERRASSTEFAATNLSWDGHVWLMRGPYVADISLLRTARSRRAHPVLRNHVESEFSSRAGLLIVRESDSHLSGLEYEAEYVMRPDEILRLANGARKIFNLASP